MLKGLIVLVSTLAVVLATTVPTALAQSGLLR